ncbi:Pisatin demethylase [Madurella mycetomatis]|uniref:Cytochrome P450 monooxygenase ABA1 n=1 Tax=Madurella mycetomatis TaxID=100816 RepID=A0A175W9L2_9PEZI|nr:Pisatin demethylase [Madurella mycetomatis]
MLLLETDVTAGSYLLIFGVAALIYYVASSVIAWRRLRKFNGPFLGSFSYAWIMRACASGGMGERFAAASARYGSGPSSTVRIGPNELITSDPEVIRRTSAARSKYTRSDWYRLNSLDRRGEAMFSTCDTATHDRLKAQTAAGYAGKDNPHLEAEIDSVVAQMVEKIRTKYAARGGRERSRMPMFDIARMSQYFTLDSIAKVAFGQEFGLIREEKDIYGHIDMLHEVAAPVVFVGGVPYLRAIMGSDFVLAVAGPKPTDKRGLGRIMRIGNEIVRKRWAPDAKDQQDMLGSFMRHGLTKHECETEALFQIIAGSDTTATAIRATLLYLMTTPLVYRALQAEIDQGIRSGKISKPITNAEASELPYLQAVIYEGLRLHPPFTGIPFKVVPPEGDTIDGKYVPGGTLIAPNFWATGRHSGVFGADADVFRPERWLEDEEDGSDAKEKVAEMRRVAELVFGYGRWGCAGKMLAFMELNKVIVELLRHFDFQLVYPYRPWKSVNYNLFLQSEMWVSVLSRE